MSGNETVLIRFRGPMGVPVEIGSSILFLAFLFVGFGTLTPQSFGADVLVFLMVVGSIFAHEMGHAWACRVQGVDVEKVVLNGGGGGYCQHAVSTPRETEFIVIMGPLVNLALWAIASLGAWWMMQALLASVEDPGVDVVAAQQSQLAAYGHFQMLAMINIVLGVLNMIPVQPMDGGKLLHLALVRALPPLTALRIVGVIGFAISLIWIPAMLLLYFQLGWMLLFVPPVKIHWEMAKGNIPV